ncbi:MAG: cyclic nucleotide-binding domain-containing protein [Gammaproteobacteria bacterium]
MSLLTLFESAEDAVDFKEGTVIFEQGSPGDVMYIILDGEVEIIVDHKPLEVVHTGDLVGEMALIDSRSRSASCIAKTDCKLAPCDEKKFLFMIQEHPFFALLVMNVLVDRIRAQAFDRFSD